MNNKQARALLILMSEQVVAELAVTELETNKEILTNQHKALETAIKLLQETDGTTLLCSSDYKERTLGEYLFVREKYNRLHDMYVKRVVDELDFTPTCPLELWKEQLFAMGRYLEILRVRMDAEGIEYKQKDEV